MISLQRHDLQWFSDPLVPDGDAIFKFQTGFTLECDFETGIIGASAVTIAFKKPPTSLTGVEVAGSFTAHIHDATAGLARRDITATADFNIDGDWRLWGRATFPGGTIPGRSKLIRVFAEGED